ncbi:NUDIX domain-containing protein [uncultured Sphingomonas sp.]|uniref:NUDIX hydrolase n=1 Tax=uncultured Sphingomonas sp. TaxID=158754 RepID=UPI0035C9AA6C
MPELVPTAIPAATLIVVRDRSDSPPDLLMVRRSARMAFAAGALVFPGGRVDLGDHLLAADDEGAARIAAIRETLEEAGLPIGLDVAPDRVAPLRAALAAGEPFADALTRAHATLAPERLVPFARWLPAHHMSRIFDTRFYLARLPSGAPAATVDGTENDRLFWASAHEVLAQADAGAATLIYPTRRNLERMALFGTFDEAVANARAHRIETISPWEEERGGERWLCIPEGLGYPITAQRMAEAVRG